MVSTVNCVRLLNHRPVPLKQMIHYMLKRKEDSRKGRMKGGRLEGEMNHERLWTLRNKLRVLEGRGVGGWVSLVMSIKEGSYCMEHCVLYTNNESWITTSKTNDVIYGD